MSALVRDTDLGHHSGHAEHFSELGLSTPVVQLKYQLRHEGEGEKGEKI